MNRQAKMPVFQVRVANLPASGYAAAIRARPDELPALADACRVDCLESVEADLELTRWRSGGFEIAGEIRAVCVQPCVVTLEPVRQTIAQPAHARFVPETSALARLDRQSAAELVLDPQGEDIPETFSGDRIDLWPVVLEWLDLAIDRFPRTQDASIDPRYSTLLEAEADNAPFAALRHLAGRGDKKP